MPSIADVVTRQAGGGKPERLPLNQVVAAVLEARGRGVPRENELAIVADAGWQPGEVQQAMAGARGGDFVDSMAQGLTFGLSDEIIAARRAVGDWWSGRGGFRESYDKHLPEERASLEVYQQQHPYRAAAGEILGGAVIPGAAVGGATTLPRAIGRSMIVGGATGAAQGAGTGEGAGNRLERAAVGGGVGAVVGAALPVVEPVGRALLSKAPAAAKPMARGFVGQAVADDLAMDQPAAVAAAADRIAEANAAGKSGVTIADVGGARARGLADDVANSPNPQQNAITSQIETRQSGVRGPDGSVVKPSQGGRLIEDLGELSGVGKQRAVVLAEDLLKRKRADATPAFEKAWRYDAASDPDIMGAFKEFLSLDPATKREAFAMGKRIQQLENPGVPVPDLLDESGNLVAKPNMQMLHYLKMGLDGLVTSAYKNQPGPLGRALAGARDRFRDVLKAKNPDYKAALDQYAGASSLEDSLESGGALMGKTADEFEQRFAGMSASEKEMFRVGALSRLAAQLGGKTEGPSVDFTNLLRNDEMRRKLFALLPDQAAREKWAKRLEVEEGFSRLASTIKNSRTAPRQEVSEMVEGNATVGQQMLADIGRGAHGGLWSMVLSAFAKMGKPIGDFAKRQRRDAVGQALTKTDKDAEGYLRSLATQPPLPPYVSPRVAAPAAIGASGLVYPEPEQPGLRWP